MGRTIERTLDLTQEELVALTWAVQVALDEYGYLSHRPSYYETDQPPNKASARRIQVCRDIRGRLLPSAEED